MSSLLRVILSVVIFCNEILVFVVTFDGSVLMFRLLLLLLLLLLCWYLHLSPMAGDPTEAVYRTWLRESRQGALCSALTPSAPWCRSSSPPSGDSSASSAVPADDWPARSPSPGCCYSYRRAHGSGAAPASGCDVFRKRSEDLQFVEGVTPCVIRSLELTHRKTTGSIKLLW